MKKTVLFITLFSILLPLYCKAENDPEPDLLLSMINSYVLKLQVIPAGSHPLIYKLTGEDNIELKITQYEGLGGYEWGNIDREYTARITFEENKKLLEMLDHALELPLKDEAKGKDGSIWIFESRLYQPVEITIWNPKHKTLSRGYEGLVELEKYLRYLSKKYDSKNN